jgi:hypothetical protein
MGGRSEVIERTGTPATVYFHTEAGDILRVHDAIYREGKHTLFVPPDSRATSRIFVRVNRERRVYHFTAGEKHELTDSQLERQFKNAGFLPTEKYDPSTRTPR